MWLEIEPGDRADWLTRQSMETTILIALKRLIANHEDIDEPMGALAGLAATAPVGAAARDGLRGRRVGGWELIEEIGRGGMSVVYRARRIDADFEQVAAVKLLSLAALGTLGRERFERERRVLARLHHPHIAALIDGGLGEDGTPYLVMPLVPGCDLATHCRERGLGWEQRVALIVEICAAVAHAHRNLLVHRDLKPGNILVSDEGVPTLLDFGIAKLLNVEEEATHTGLRAMTPGYAAPEQLDGGPITTATDVYALGVILRGLCADLPALPNDLRNIVAMATRVEADRRYPDARALADDLSRLLSGNVVTATPDSLGYRMRSFLRRRRGAVAAASAILLVLVSGLAATQWQARRAEAQAREALRQSARAEAAREFLFDLFEAGNLDRTEGEDPRVSTLVERGARNLSRLDQRPELHAEMATLLARIDIAIGRHERARRLLEEAIASAERTTDEKLHAQVELAQANLANATGDSTRAGMLYERALKTREQAGASDPSFRVAVLSGWAYAMKNLGKQDVARQRIEHELSNVEMNYSANQRGELLLGQALVTRDIQRRLDLAQAAAREFAEQPTTAANELALEVELGNDLFALGNHEQGIAHTRRSVEIADQLYPGSTRYRARTYNNLGSMLRVDDQLGTAEAALAVAESIYRELGDERSAAFAALLHNRGLLLHDTGNSARGLPLVEQALALALEQFGENDRRSGLARRSVALLRAAATADPQANVEWNRAREHAWDAFRPAEQIDTLLIGAEIALELNQPQARARLLEADALIRSGQSELSNHQRIRRDLLWGTLQSMDGQEKLAKASFDAASRIAHSESGNARSRTWQVEMATGEHFQRMGEPSSAKTHYRAALDSLLELGADPAATSVVELSNRLAALDTTSEP
ncbi:protein kinase [Dokdonella sp.]|uniref:protein kinase domain-containing protein n=1 Tax=Dokdonella sp. TaxID=2291710 RepID=UPI003526F454